MVGSIDSYLHFNTGRRTYKVAAIRLLLIVILVSLSWVGFSQPYTSRLGRFQVDQVLGCAPFTVNIGPTNLKPGHDCSTSTCQMTFEPSVVEQSTFTYTYNTPGTYSLQILFPSTLIDPVDDITITVLPNIPPDFDIYTCSGNGVSIKITDKNYDQYYIDFGDGTGIINVPSGNNPTAQHTYPSSALYNITLHGKKNGAADDCNSMVKGFNAVLVLPAPFINTLTSVDANNIKLDFSSAPNIQLRLEIAVNNSGTFQLVQNLYAVTTTLVTGLDLTNNFYCFRLNAHDPCTGTDTPSNIICSQKFLATTASDVDQLSWTTGSGVAGFTVNRDGSLLTTIAGNSFNDVTIICNTQYCYQLFSNYANGSNSISLLQCVTSFSSKIPTLINNSSAVVSSEGVELTWQQDPAYSTTEYAVFRKTGSAGFVFQTYAPGQIFDDVNYTTAGDYCYAISYTDQCKNNSPLGSPICPIRLVGVLDKSNFIHLTWSQYRGWLKGVKNYTLERFDKNGVLNKTVSTGTDTTYIDNQFDTVNQVVSYKVTANSNEGGLTASVSNIATFVKEANLYSPTAFSPDHNSLNETFTVRGFFITHLQLRIFNRWGTLMFSTETNQSWDGTFNGRAMPNDTYVWTASITDSAGQHFSKTGTVLLVTTKK